jgi:pyruvate formate lyase activating enzyme
MSLPYYGLASSLAMDPIEKKPLHHFLPGSSVLSIGFVGCNMRCPFCQNWSISQEIPSSLERFTPESLVSAALGSGAPSIAYTYSEPTVHYEFLLDCMAAARGAGLKNVLVTNGCIVPGAARELLGLTDAVNVDLKTWSQEAYRRDLGGDRDSVLDFIRIAAELCHVEVTTLVVPGISDSPGGMSSISSFLLGISPSIPLHLSAYHPAWKHDAPPCPEARIEELARAARADLEYVYLGNMPGERADTICPGCGSIAVARIGYRIEPRALSRSGRSGHCASCGRSLNMIL